MKFLSFNDNIYVEPITVLIDSVNKTDDDEIYIYFGSTGGSVPVKNEFLHFLNTTEKKITLVISWEVTSAAFDIVIKAPHVQILDGAFGEMHFCSKTVDYTELKDPDSIDSWLAKEVERQNRQQEIEYSPFFTKAEMKKMAMGKLVRCDTKRLRSIRNKWQKQNR